MPKTPTPAGPSVCKALHGCNGLERGRCSHADSLEQQRKHLTAQARPSLFELWGFKAYVRLLRTTILPVCAHPDQLRDALKKVK